ncbi:hypothetical protein P8452_61014 [Trifolium repens]|nr:hypothetical protein P8452_61014 [Trifolium repens]
MREKGSVEREREGSIGVARASPFKRRGYIHNVDQASISYFVTNFPEDCSTEDLWKLFARRDDSRKKEEAEPSRGPFQDTALVIPERSFKTALVHRQGVEKSKKLVEEEEVLKVDVDSRVLKELEQSSVGRLAINVEVKRIRSTLFMEGFAHISVTDMGSKMVLIHSPFVGEVERLWKAKVDWITYYFNKVTPWSPSSFASSREVWVKVYGIPLHVWGENLFKAIGSRYGEFIDFDNNTASRAKLDVARIKMATGFCGEIDDALKIMALGVEYSLRVVEEKGMEQVFMHGDRSAEQEGSWVESHNAPVEVMAEDGDDSGGSTEEGDEDDDVDLSHGQHQASTLSKKVDGDVTLAEEGKCQTSPFVSAGVLEDQFGNGVLYVSEDVRGEENEGVLEGHVCEKVTKSGKGVETEVDGVAGLMETCPVVGKEVVLCGPGRRLDEEVEKNIQFFINEPNRSVNQTRSSSLPPNRLSGPLLLGFQNQDLNLSDSISLCEVRRGVDNNSVCNFLPQPQIVASSIATQPEMAKEGGGGRQRKKKKGGEVTKSDKGKQIAGSSINNGENVIARPIAGEATSLEGLNLEVVLLIIDPTPHSGELRAVGGVDDGGGQYQELNFSESSKLLHIQKDVGFGYVVPDEEVILVLANEENRDRLKKQEWEQKNGSQ